MATTPLPAVPTVQLRIDRRVRPPTNDSGKAKLLRRAVAALASERENGSSCLDVVKKARDAGMYDIAEGAADACHELKYLGLCVHSLFGEHEYWSGADEGFVTRCEKRLIPAAEDDYGWRSNGLAFLGAFRLFTGKADSARRDWEAARNIEELDSSLCQAILGVARHAHDGIDELIDLADVIRTRSEQASLLADLSDYVE